MTQILRDATGMIGSISFAWIQGSDLDNNAKQWRLVADVLNDTAMLLELISPLLPAYFLFLVCVASLARAIVGVAGGATRAALIQHQARNNNMGDVAAKDGSQETLVNLVALLVNLILVPLVSQNAQVVWSLFGLSTCCHIFFNYKAVRSLCMTRLNGRRAHLIVEHYTRHQQILSPKIANQREPLFFDPVAQRIQLGASLLQLYAVILAEEATPADMQRAYFSALFSHYEMQDTTPGLVRSEPTTAVDAVLSQLASQGWSPTVAQYYDHGYRVQLEDTRKKFN
ncbi:uncharacterized protein MONBRDRAFT_26990 [Monosiga brevicollis MX1]|uniref:Protein root UVB sensitive/RUS domain-containing protein n=1 Tax=Monosiga brevicollis TaxID=81824 RepID=A9V3I9_MONBE|nr:uncharacterized protein MONBRDRAFT_26990 [Monosiga brevicollis MX1]EDQ87821.1 predicted protein [Monosiga brevicollis MX1]|eukprot:XP_001747354.1 hypothetical protein [Monosiga brevicollis MX1]